MGKKQIFAKLTEDLENTETSISKSEEPEVKAVEEPAPIVEPENVQPELEQPKATPETSEEEPKEDKEPEEGTSVDKSEEEPKDEPEEEPETEEVEKSAKDDKDKSKDKEPLKKSKCPNCGTEMKNGKCPECGKGEGKDEEDVKKSEPSEDAVTEADFLSAFEAVTKSYGNLNSRMDSIEKTLSTIMDMLKPAEPVVKSEDTPTEEPEKETEDKEETSVPEGEEVSKSVTTEEEDLEGKAVEFIAKSEEGTPEVPVATAEEDTTLESEEVEFNAREHVSDVTNYFLSNGHKMSPGEQAAFRGAVNRVKRNEGTDADIELFKEIAKLYKN